MAEGNEEIEVFLQLIEICDYTRIHTASLINTEALLHQQQSGLGELL